MQYAEVRQFIKEANTVGLSPIEKDVFQYYYSKTQNEEGVWHCPDSETAEEIYRSRNGVCEARKKLISRNWIADDGSFNIKILKSFSVGNPTHDEEVPVGNATEVVNPSRKPDSSVGNPTQTAEISVGNPTLYKDKRNIGIEDKLEDKELNINALAQTFPLKILYDAFPQLELQPAKAGFIISAVTEKDEAAWISTVKLYQQNHDPEKERYLPEKVGNLLKTFESEKAKLAREKGVNNVTKFPSKPTNSDIIARRINIDTSDIPEPYTPKSQRYN